MTQRPAKAPGMTWLSPLIIARDIAREVAFCERAFGFTKVEELTSVDGQVIHAVMTYRDCCMMFGPEVPTFGAKAPTTIGGTSMELYLYVEDVRAFYDQAVAAGARVVEPVKDQYWGDRTCLLRSPEGHQWWFAQNVADFDPSRPVVR